MLSDSMTSAPAPSPATNPARRASKGRDAAGVLGAGQRAEVGESPRCRWATPTPRIPRQDHVGVSVPDVAHGAADVQCAPVAQAVTTLWQLPCMP